MTQEGRPPPGPGTTNKEERDMAIENSSTGSLEQVQEPEEYRHLCKILAGFGDRLAALRDEASRALAECSTVDRIEVAGFTLGEDVVSHQVSWFDDELEQLADIAQAFRDRAAMSYAETVFEGTDCIKDCYLDIQKR
jgi:hypothetical protein